MLESIITKGLETVGIPFPKVINDHFKEVIKSYQHQQKRNSIEDGKRFKYLLENNGYSFQFQDKFDEGKLDTSSPTMMVVTHYHRDLLDRMWPSTSGDILITSISATLPCAEILNTDISWLVQNDFDTSYKGVEDFARIAMRATEYSYGYIGVPKEKSKKKKKHEENNNRSIREAVLKIPPACIDKLSNGINIGAFPEGKVKKWRQPYKLSDPDPAFKGLLRRINDAHPDFQLFPFTVYSDNKSYITVASELIRVAKDPEKAIELAMASFRDNLPAKFLG